MPDNAHQQTLTDYDRSYLRSVLDVAEDEEEERLDDRLKAEARELGVDTEAQAKAQSTKTASSDVPRRSASIGSRASQSTGLTSNFSDASREPHGPKGRARSRASLSLRDYDAFVARGRSNGRSSISFSPSTTPAQSTFSLALSSPESPPRKHFRRIRALGAFKLGRSESTSTQTDRCPHCLRDAVSQRRAVHKLPCGHRLCTQALRSTIKSATDSKTGAIPSCCGLPIPGTLLEHVMTQEEQSTMLDKVEQWDEAASVAPSVGSEPQEGSPRRLRPGRAISQESKVESLSPKSREDLDRVLDSPEFKLLRTCHEEQRNRYLAWMEDSNGQISAQHSQLKEETRSRHERAIDELQERQSHAMTDAEDKQVKAEADLRHAQIKGKRDNATALKHMEAYCAGKYSTGEPHNRTVTEQDRAELDKTLRSRDQMDGKHESAINVLRGEQGRRMRLRAQRQEKELQELLRGQRKEELELDRQCNGAVRKLSESSAEKRRRLVARWELQTAILLRRAETEDGSTLHLHLHLPPVDWHVSSPEDIAPTAAGAPIA